MSESLSGKDSRQKLSLTVVTIFLNFAIKEEIGGWVEAGTGEGLKIIFIGKI